MKDDSKVCIRGFFRAQLVNRDNGKIEGDSGWVQNKMTNAGLTTLANLIGGNAAGKAVVYAAAGTQTDVFDMSQTDLTGRTHGFVAVGTGTSGTCTQTFTVDFGSALLSASCNVGAIGLFSSNAAGGMYAGQIFTTSQWNTNQDFQVTYQVRFATV